MSYSEGLDALGRVLGLIPPKPDCDYKRFAARELVSLHKERSRRLAELEKLRAPEPIIGFERRLVRQSGRLLAERGIKSQ